MADVKARGTLGPIVANGSIMSDVAVRKSYSGYIVTPDWCKDMAWRIVISSHATEEEAEAKAARLRSTRKYK